MLKRPASGARRLRGGASAALRPNLNDTTCVGLRDDARSGCSTTYRTTAKEAIDAQVQRSHEGGTRRSQALPDLEHAKTAVLNSPDVGQRDQQGWQVVRMRRYRGALGYFKTAKRRDALVP
jgi:hypothetical protein